MERLASSRAIDDSVLPDFGGKRRQGAIERNGGSLDGGAGDRFRDRDQLGVKLAYGFSDIGVVEAAHKRGWQVVGHARATVRTPHRCRCAQEH